MGNRLNIHLKKFVGVMGVLLVTAGSPRAVEAIPLSNSVIDAATLCEVFDCGAGVDTTDTYSFAPAPDPDGTLTSFAAPGFVGFFAAALFVAALAVLFFGPADFFAPIRLPLPDIPIS